MPQGNYLNLTKEQIVLIALKMSLFNLQMLLAKLHHFVFCGSVSE